jgi:hypothetical protein
MRKYQELAMVRRGEEGNKGHSRLSFGCKLIFNTSYFTI